MLNNGRVAWPYAKCYALFGVKLRNGLGVWPYAKCYALFGVKLRNGLGVTRLNLFI